MTKMVIYIKKVLGVGEENDCLKFIVAKTLYSLIEWLVYKEGYNNQHGSFY